MIRLAATDKLELQTSSTSAIDWDVSIDTITATGVTPSPLSGTVVAAGTIDLVAAGSDLRQVRYIAARNNGAANNIVSIKKDLAGTERVQFSATLGPGDAAYYSSNTGWQIIDSQGRLETSNVTVRDNTSAIASTRQPINKLSVGTQVAGSETSLWRLTNFPAQALAPGVAANCNAATAGAVFLAARSGIQKRLLTEIEFATGNPGQTVYVEDRLAHMGGLNGTLLTAQTVGVDVSVGTDNMVERIGAADYSEVEWYMEWYTATGATIATPTFAVTHFDNSTSPAVPIFVLGAGALPASVAASRRYKIVPANGLPIKSIQSCTLSASTGTAGSFGVTAVRRYESAATDLAGKSIVKQIPVSNARVIPDNACLTYAMLTTATTTGTLTGSINQTVVAS
jgi:hypothetical protein